MALSPVSAHVRLPPFQERSDSELSPLCSQRFCTKGRKGIPVYYPSPPNRELPGGKDQRHFSLFQPLPPAAASSVETKIKPPLGEGSHPEIWWRRQTAQSLGRKQKAAQKAALLGGVLTRRPSAGPEPRKCLQEPRGVWTGEEDLAAARDGLGSIHPLLF